MLDKHMEGRYQSKHPQHLANNVIGLPQLRTYTGKAQSMASLLYTWRPFVHMLYGAIHGAPDEYQIWTKQVRPAITWLLAFLDSHAAGNLIRTFDVGDGALLCTAAGGIKAPTPSCA